MVGIVATPTPASNEPLSLTASCIAEVSKAASAPWASGPPLPLQPVLSALGVHEVRLRPLGHDARLVVERGRPVVEVNSLLHPWYRRLCIAHELGHLIAARVSRLRRRAAVGAEVEVENLCDRLARELVIPKRALAPLFHSPRTSVSAVADAAELFEVPVDIMATRVFGDFALCPSSFAVILRRDTARLHFKGRVHSTLIRPSTVSLETGSLLVDRMVREPPLRAVLIEAEAWRKMDELAVHDSGRDYRVSLVPFDFLRLAPPLRSETGALLLVCPVIQPEVN